MSPAPTSWLDYLSDFHRQRPGITEDVLSVSRSRCGLTPYDWITAPIPLGARTLDLACGSGASLRVRGRDPWIGLDRSASELARARRAGSTNVLEGDATSLPFGDESFDAVVCSMALMLIEPIERALDEARRVLAPEGFFVATLPGRRPLRARDVLRYTRLVRRLGLVRLNYPNMRVLADASALARDHGFELVEDVRTRFDYPIATSEESSRFVRSLYVPSVASARIERADALAATWVGSSIGIPLRRLTMVRASTKRER